MFISSDPFIWVRDEVFCPEFCDDVINRFREDDSKMDGVCGLDRSVKPEMKRSVDLMISGKEGWEDIDTTFHQNLMQSCIEYKADISQHFQLKNLPTHPDEWAGWTPLDGHIEDSGYQLQETTPGGFYDWHDDSAVEIAGGLLRERSLTYLWYLNDIEDGGETEFFNGIRIQPRAGRLLLFPALWNYMHRGRPLGTKSPVNKYISTGWIYRTQEIDTNPEPQQEEDDGLDYTPPPSMDTEGEPFTLKDKDLQHDHTH